MGKNQTQNSSTKNNSSGSSSDRNQSAEHFSSDNKTPKHLNGLFWSILFSFAGVYLLLIVAFLLADFQFSSVADLRKLISDPSVRYSTSLSVISSTIASFMAMWIAVPTGYWLARFESNQSTSFIRRFTKKLIFALLDFQPLFSLNLLS